ncbi:MAG: hypothetical protein SFY81_02860 [Verrucomicrobiota bacterium]|nr:hypothetical protein [Verrucomicrobiota bacterium]
MNLEEQIRFYCPNFPSEKLKVSRLDQIDFKNMERGVLFIFATWSGSSVVSFKLLCDALMSAGERTSFPLYVVDIDEINSESFKQNWSHSLNGNGETMWIKGGTLVAFDIGYTDKRDRVLQNSDMLRERIALLKSP